MAEERKSWAPWFQRRIDQQSEPVQACGFVWLTDVDEGETENKRKVTYKLRPGGYRAPTTQRNP